MHLPEDAEAILSIVHTAEPRGLDRVIIGALPAGVYRQPQQLVVSTENWQQYEEQQSSDAARRVYKHCKTETIGVLLLLLVSTMGTDSAVRHSGIVVIVVKLDVSPLTQE